MPLLQERIEGGLLGLLVGDALGVPYEFHEPETLPALERLEFDPPPGFARAHSGTPPGTWSDDGAQALALLASLLRCDGFHPPDFADALVDWSERGGFAVDARVFDVGVQTARAIATLKRGVDPLYAGSSEVFSQGNGSLMRVLPLALWHRGSDAELVRLAHDQSRVTHGHAVCRVCCALYCLWARRLLAGEGDGWDGALEALRFVYVDQPEHAAVLAEQFRPGAAPEMRGSGYVLDCLFSARWALSRGPYEAVVKAAVSLGHDTDTTACVAGGLAGIRDGVNAIPARWREGLRGRGILDPLLARLLERA